MKPALIGTGAIAAYVASEMHKGVWVKGTAPATAKGVLVLPSSAARASAWFAAGEGSTAMYALARAGFVVMAGDCGKPSGQTTVGNATSTTRVGQMKSFVQGGAAQAGFRTFAMPAASGKVALMGSSGGGLDALNYARANPTLVSCIALVSVPTDLERAHSENNAGFAALIETAWGGAGPYAAAMPAGNPHGTGNQAALAGIPIKMWNSSNDPYNCASMNSDYVTLINNAGGNASQVSLGAVGHSIGNLDPAQVAAFFTANHV